MPGTSERLLALLALMQQRREWSGPDLADRLEVGVRTIRRDIDRLRGLGYPVEATPGVAGGYRLAPGASLPPLLLDDDEATAIAVGLRTAAGGSVAGIEESSLRALVKLEQVLPARLRGRVAALAEATTVTMEPPGPRVDAESLALVAGACRDHEILRFSYRTRLDAASDREVEPHSLVNVGRRWYLLAWDRDRLDWRTFRLDRLSDPALTGRTFVPRRLPAADAAEFVSRSIRGAPSRYEARVTVRAPAAVIRDRVAAHWGEVEPIDAETCEYRSSDDNLQWLTLRIAMLDADFDVHEPPELIAHMRSLSARLAWATKE